eukprot:CAMPEP_0183312752 /NCGR_PEP_ID=MMETSP0160_2-20130417/42905_1 /TAXON_ID=2839 ORGANISM="Odontella Sinensis, Strain Grunow 1884" /NCGR_SAMPLE_ID=MMETSP0160_2 /ASSEMBLY_ACC=CAM_ASM_000250 /LENGTH=163 /DNA_ID=CAMNT_0025477671 /DNA_START=1 /DNA_END=488 /DNA_ORIENTATION=-
MGVSAWAVLVEPSNGETMRCVRRRPAPHKRNGGGGGGGQEVAAGGYGSLPVVELHILIQNTGTFGGGGLEVLGQPLAVDASTRRRGEIMDEITWDPRLRRRAVRCDGSPLPSAGERGAGTGDDDVLFRLGLFESAVLVAYVHARGCATASKFRRRANSAQLSV